jgi:Ca2+-transporting ATPase
VIQLSENKNAELKNPSKDFYNIPIEDVYMQFEVNPEKGLTQALAKQHLDRYGPNELQKKKKSFWKIIIAPIINLLIIIYLIGALILLFLGKGERALPNIAILAVNAVIAIIQQLRAEKQLDALKKLSQANAVVIRDGEELTIPTEQIVLGDIVKLKQGDKIPADCRVIEGRNLSLDESSLTGESEPVRKNSTSELIKGKEIPIQDQKNMLFFGTFIASGQGTAVVVKIGMQTELGKINRLLEESSTGDIPLRQKMNHFAKYLGLLVVVLMAIAMIYRIGIVQDPDLKEAIANSLDLGMKVLPINLPLLTTIVLLTGTLAMALKGVIVRELSSTESLGRVSVVCSDKTGTLTKNQMTVQYVWTINKEYEVTGHGYEPEGIIRPLNDESQVSVNNSHLDKLIISGFLNNNASLQSEQVTTMAKEKSKVKWSIVGLPTEASLKVLAKKYSSNFDEKIKDYTFVAEFSFESSVKRMSKLYKNAHKHYLFTKGATEWTIQLATHYLDEDNVFPMNENIKNSIMTNMQKYADKGFRVLSIYYRELDANQIPSTFEDPKLREKLEKDLIFVGFVVILDPPRDDVYDAVQQCKSAGIRVVMITGDSISTAKAIASKLSIYDEKTDLAVEGKLLPTLSDEDFPKVSVYGRVSPEHKQIIIERYQKMKKVVSMTGDGVNDALALSMADCGLAMGIQGTEVAKEAADMVITDDSFSTIITGVKEGRGLFMKIRTIIYFFLCISLMEATILFVGSFLPVINYEMWEPWQLNLLYLSAHAFPSLGFTFGNNSRTIMSEKPRDSAEIISLPILKLMVSHVFLMGFAIVFAYWLCMAQVLPMTEYNLSGIAFESPQISLAQSKARTLAFVVLFILESLVLPFQIRRINQPFREAFLDIDYRKEFLFYIPSILILVGLIYNVEIQNFMATNLNWTLNFMYLDVLDWVVAIALCIPVIVIFELIRTSARKKGTDF